MVAMPPPSDPAALDVAYTQASDDVRGLDKDRFLSTLFIPDPPRRHVLAILAFSAEIARVRDVVSQPLPGEIRLQWWRDLLAAPSHDAALPPMARALLDTIDRFNLPRSAFLAMIDARVFDLYDDPMPSLNDLEGYCGETASALFQLAALVVSEGQDPGAAEAAGHAGVAYALTGLIRSVAFHASRGQIYLPADVLFRHGAEAQDIRAGRTTPALTSALAELRGIARSHLTQARGLVAGLAPNVRPVFLPLALVAPSLKQMDCRDYDPFKTPIVSPQWLTQIRLCWAARKG
jgi:phytoene synthase